MNREVNVRFCEGVGGVKFPRATRPLIHSLSPEIHLPHFVLSFLETYCELRDEIYSFAVVEMSLYTLSITLRTLPPMDEKVRS